MGESTGRSMNEALGEAEKASLRARGLTQRLLTFAKGGAPIKKPLAVVPLVQECAARSLHSTGVTPDFYLAENLWPAVVDESQIEQVLHNLFSFVRSSLSTNPRLDIHVLNQEVESDSTLVLNPGRYVLVSIRDYGTGLERDQLSKIFEPYFGPKRNGSGLELTTAYSIMRKHDGQIAVESIAGQGTMFHVYLPAAVEQPAVPVEDCKPSAPSRPLITPRRILVMDDELSLRQLAAHVLARLGHTVETVADGAEAIQVYQAGLQNAEPFDAVIMDLTIPNGMGGQETIGELLQIDPNVRAIVCSGYSNDPVMANFRDYGFGGVVPKPYSPDDLARAVDDLLDAGAIPA
jgi:CheY-like chemotaxis protein